MLRSVFSQFFHCMNFLASDLAELHVRSNRGRTNAGLARGSTRNPATRNTSRANFRFRQRGAHLTYKSHIAFDIIKSKLAEVGGADNPIKWYSIVHERGQPDGESHERYDHTHVAWQWEKAVDKSNARIFDITSGEEAIHPHIQLFSNQAHMQQIYDDYHHKEPVELEQSEDGPTPSVSFIEQIVRAPTLYAACEIAGVEIRSVNDIKLLRDDKPLPEEYTHLYPDTEWLLDAPFTRCCYIWGATGTGKTQWAVHQFNRPLVVSTRDSLRHFRRDLHDGIVFDDIDFSTWEREELIHLFDWDIERTIRCRYSDATIPRFTKKVVTSNRPFETNFHMDVDIGAIKRRFDKIVHTIGPTFRPPVPALTTPQETTQEERLLDPQEEAHINSLPPSPPHNVPAPEVPLFTEHGDFTSQGWDIRADELDILGPHFGEFMMNRF